MIASRVPQRTPSANDETQIQIGPSCGLSLRLSEHAGGARGCLGGPPAREKVDANDAIRREIEAERIDQVSDGEPV